MSELTIMELRYMQSTRVYYEDFSVVNNDQGPGFAYLDNTLTINDMGPSDDGRYLLVLANCQYVDNDLEKLERVLAQWAKDEGYFDNVNMTQTRRYYNQFTIDDTHALVVPKFLLEYPWFDVSWGNEVCPRFENTILRLAVWVDYDDPANRELNCVDGPYEENVWKKFCVVRIVSGYLSDDILYSTEDATELEDFLSKQEA